jgi:uncharacterized protein with von Willebrand factor type A (vWA) domain
VAASDEEVLRHRDIATLDAAERARLAGLFSKLRPAPPRRVSYRRVAARRGVVDTHETLRRTLTRLGEPVEIAWRHRSTRPRRTVLLVDISGSMSSYADALLRFAHRVSSTGAAETFSVGTRVTRLTPAMRLHDTDRALVAAGSTGGVSAGWRAEPSSWSSATAGSAATPGCWASRWPGCTGWRTAWSG